ncbi:MAG: ECF transporter S component [Anaerovoracaceae bacterium]
MTTLDNTIKTKQRSTTYTVVINGLFIALIFVATWLINIRLPFIGSGGLIHLGNVPLFVGAMMYGRKTGAITGAFGMALFDLFSGWTAWAPFTFVIVGLMGYTIGLISEKKPFKKAYICNIFAVIMAIAIKIVGYYFTEVILFGNWITPLGSIPGNIIQVGVAGILVLTCIEKLKKIARV